MKFMNANSETPFSLSLLRKSRPVSQGPRLRLELLSERHLTLRYVDWLNDPEVCQFNRHGSGYTLEKAKSYYDSVRDSTDTVVFAICLKESGEHLGNISLNDIDWAQKSSEISILIGEKKHWGKGFGDEAIRLMIDFALKTLKLKRVWIGMTVNNTGMIRIAEKMGFQHERILKKAFKKNGQEWDVTEWGLRNPEEERS